MVLFSAKPTERKMYSSQYSRKTIGVDMFILKNKNYLCIVDYCRKFPVIKTEDLSAESLIIGMQNYFFFQNMVCQRKQCRN